MIRFHHAVLAVAVTTSPAFADLSLSVPLPLDGDGGVISASYSCDGGEAFPVQYINSGVNSLALLPVDGEERIFVNVISGSGARYVSGQYEWWSKGDSATLSDEMADTTQECSEVGADETR